MIVRFIASRCESDFWREKGREGFSILLSDAAKSHYLSLQRGHPFNTPDDWGVYVEVDYQWLSGYHRIAACTLSPASMKLNFRRPLEALGRNEVIDGVEATFADGCVPTDEFRQHLRAVFTGWEENLRVIDGGESQSVT